ncbi:MAG: putative ATPase/DNA-binding winged helix-turn-helix (wHTH) protein [Kiritimatiellia bacterium]|jgi:predicted ATPase/DNA-binding winged helix-turn-helix (wHTH) protein
MPTGELLLDTCKVQLAAGVVLRHDGEVRLTTREVELLAYLAARRGEAVDRETLLQDVWGYSSGVVTRAVDATVNRLRAKIEAEPSNPTHLVTVWGQGYRLELPEHEVVVVGRRLPAAIDPFIGRREELEALSQAFAGGARLVTITGPGGMGKTRLALQFSRGLEPDLPDGVWFVDASEVRTEAGLVFAVAAALGGGADDMRCALMSLGSGLLVLDNLEQVVEVAAPQVVRWLRAAPSVRIIATSRERLRVPGERVVDLGPLHPDDAAVLLIERAGSAAPGVALAEDDVQDIVRRLEGIPLALELAAGLLDVLGAAGLRKRLCHPVDVLTDGGRTRPARHESLERVIKSSWDLLGDAERGALASLSVFRGGFTPDAAEAVLGAHAVSLLHRLRAKSLLRLLPGEGHRLGAYDVIRDFSAKFLSDDLPAERHRAWFATQAMHAYDPAGEMPTLDDQLWLSAEADNLWAALSRSGPVVQRVRIALALAYCHVLKGPLPLAERALQLVADLPGVPPALMGHVMRMSSRVSICRGRPDEAHRNALRALGCAREANDDSLRGRSLLMLGLATAWRGDAHEAIALFDEAIVTLRDAGDSVEASAWANRGNVLARLGDDVSARRAWERALGLHQDNGNARSAAVVLGNLGLLAVDNGNAEEGVRCLRRAMELHMLGGDEHAQAVTRSELGHALLQLGQLAEADVVLREATRALRRHGDRAQIPQALWGWGVVKFCGGDAASALRLFQQAATYEADPTSSARLDLARAIAAACDGDVHLSRGFLAGLQVPSADEEAGRRVRWLVGVAVAHLLLTQGRVDLAKSIADGAEEVNEGRVLVSRAHETGPFLRVLRDRISVQAD